MMTYQEERFSDLRIEAAELFEQHWREAGNRPEPVDMDWGSYRAMEDAGVLLTVTARHYGRLVGYAAFVIWKHPHHRTITVADCDCVFLEGGRRQGLAGQFFIRHIEKVLRNRGVQEIHIPVRPINHTKRGDRSLMPLMVRLGYRLQSMVFGKVLSHG